MKIGMIGCGGMGTTHYLAYKALEETGDIEVAAIADCRKEFLEKAAGYFPNAVCYDSGMELLEKETLDIADICLPSYLHASHAIKALEKGCHVLVEKPVCLSEEDCQALLQAEEKYGKKVMVGQVLRSYDEYLFLKQAFEKGTYGRLQSIVMQRLSGDVQWGFEDWFHDEERSGSVILDLHIHDLDFMMYMLGEPDAYDVKATAYSSGMINQVVTTYQYGDVFAVTEGLWAVSPSLPFQAIYRACFEEAVVEFNTKAKPTLTVYHKDGRVENPTLVSEYAAESDAAGINVSNLGPYYAEIKYFIDCVRLDKPVETAPLKAGAASVRQALKEWKTAKQYIQNLK